MMGHYESPVYDIVFKEGPFEIRAYETFMTTFVNEQNLRGTSGFGVLFGYISGNNTKQMKMKMTVPVINHHDGHQMSMEFVIPSVVRKEGIPDPKNPMVDIKTYPAHYAGVYRFSGRTTKETIDRARQHLEEWLSIKGYQHQDQYRLARYNPPFSIPMLRRNEIHVVIDEI